MVSAPPLLVSEHPGSDARLEIPVSGHPGRLVACYIAAWYSHAAWLPGLGSPPHAWPGKVGVSTPCILKGSYCVNIENTEAEHSMDKNINDKLWPGQVEQYLLLSPDPICLCPTVCHNTATSKTLIVVSLVSTWSAFITGNFCVVSAEHTV